MKRARALTASFGVRHAPIILVALATLFLLFSFISTSRAPMASAETRFVETSSNGLQMVPASCPSTPDYAGQCSCPNGLDFNTHPTCVCPAGQVQSGAQCITPPTTASACNNGLDISQYPSCVCPANQVQSGNICVTVSNSCSNGLNANQYPSCSCPEGQIQSGSQCINAGGGCPAGQTLVGGRCVSSSCPTGFTLVNGSCVVSSCPLGYTLVGGICVVSSCPTGYTLVNGACVINVCNPSLICGSGANTNKVVNSCTGAVAENCLSHGSKWSCQNGICVAPPPPAINLTVLPLLIHRNDTVRVTWSASNVVSCTLTSNSGDAWDTTSGSETSGTIEAQTVFTLTCLGDDDTTATAQKTVTIIPIFEEVCSPGFVHVNGICVRQ